MSDFVQQQNSICDFNSSDSWVILSPIEQSIKRKIEAVGTPLKDWDIQINYGIKTGFNDAFIISTEKRNEILANCRDAEERKRTEKLIRPILRGRDIKRYGYVDNGLYLINTHNGVRGRIPRIKIEDYPAVKAHLDQYWDRIATRADKGDTPYNLRNCAYLDKFFALSEEKQITIINAALQCFGKFGYDKASVNDIAVTAHISKASVFQYFGSKKQLYTYLLEYCMKIIMPLKSASNLNGNLNCSKELEHYAS